jgi:carboxylesterase
MVNRITKLAGTAAQRAKSVLIADPNLLYKEEWQLVNQPFFFEGTNGKGILLVHGWTSTPYEVRRLGMYLNENGYTVYGMMLSGHGTVPKDLEDIIWQQWVEDVQKGYDKLRKTCDNVYIGGTSIGANLALIIAKKNSNIAGLILMAAPYRLRMERTALLFAKLLTKMKKRYRHKVYPPTFGVATTITRLISYQSYPVKSALDVFEAIKESRKDLHLVKQPCLIMQSTHDHIVCRHSMEKLYDKLGSQKKKKQYIKKAYHTFISDIKNEHVFRDILEFLNEN